MEVEARFLQLERQHDWEGAKLALEQAIASAESAEQKASLHLRLGRLLRDQFLQGVVALKHFQDAYKLNSALVESLTEAREIYWQLGKLAMVQKLLALELKADAGGPRASELYSALGDVQCDQGDMSGAAASAQGAAASGQAATAGAQDTAATAKQGVEDVKAAAKGAQPAPAEEPKKEDNGGH